MLLLAVSLVLFFAALMAARGWSLLPTTDRVLVVVMLGYVAMALLLPLEPWHNQVPQAGTWFYLGVSGFLVIVGLLRAFQANPLTPGHRELLLCMAAVAALPALLTLVGVAWWGA